MISSGAHYSAASICAIAQDLYTRGWMPGTSGNISTRHNRKDASFTITASGQDKGSLAASDICLATVTDGAAIDCRTKPSAEASIHAAIYRATDAQAVIHVHSPFATAVACGHRDDTVSYLPVTRYELVKGLRVTDDPAPLPIFQNWPDVTRIATDVYQYLSNPPAGVLPAILIAYHGVTVWGDSLRQARNRLECVESVSQLMIFTRHGGPTAPDTAER